MVLGIIKYFKTIIDEPIGDDDDKLSLLALMRKTAIFWLPISFIFAIIFIFFNLYIGALGLLLICVNHVYCIHISYRGFKNLPRILEAIIPSLLIFILGCIEFPSGVKTKLMLIILNFSLLTFSFIFFSLKEWKIIVMSSLLILMYGGLYEYIGPLLYIEKKNVFTQSFAFENFIYIVSVGMLSLCFFLFKKMIERQVLSIKKLLTDSEFQKEEIATQRDEIEAQRDYVINQKDDIEESIIYAKQIQQAILPSRSILKNYFHESFIYFKPKNIVSGDFYWMTKIGHKKIIVAADCTGHGVPGALMSVLGITFLNEIVKVEKEINPHIILAKLRIKIIALFEKTISEETLKDGMDISIAIIDSTTNLLEFAGANSKMYIISNSILHELQGDKMPVGFSHLTASFTLKTYQLLVGDTVFMFSDGYRDQFGGPKNKRIQTKLFKKMLCENTDKTMKEMEYIVNTTFQNWKGSHEQVDDVLVMGFKI